MTREQLNLYVGKGSDALYNKVTNDAKTLWKGAKDTGKQIIKAVGWLKK